MIVLGAREAHVAEEELLYKHIKEGTSLMEEALVSLQAVNGVSYFVRTPGSIRARNARILLPP